MGFAVNRIFISVGPIGFRPGLFHWASSSPSWVLSLFRKIVVQTLNYEKESHLLERCGYPSCFLLVSFVSQPDNASQKGSLRLEKTSIRSVHPIISGFRPSKIYFKQFIYASQISTAFGSKRNQNELSSKFSDFSGFLFDLTFPAMSATPMLPVSTSEPNVESKQSATTPNLHSILARLSGCARLALSRCRPWTELVDRTAFTKPASFSDATSRVRKNFSYFRANYLTILAGVLAFSLISHPFSLVILLSLLSAWLFLYALRPSDQPVVIWGRTYSDIETLAILVASTVIVIFLTSVGSLLISGILMGLGIVCAHGAFRMPEDLFLDEQEPLGSGLFSFVSGAASSAAAAAAAPAIISRV